MGRERVFSHLTRLSVLVCCLFLPSIAAQAATFTVNSPADAGGAAPLNDGICATQYNNNVSNGVCTLRAAIEEANALAGADQVILPALPAPNAYLLTIASQLVITDNLIITGGGAATTNIDGNKAVRPNSGVLVIGFATVSISEITIRNGGRTTGSGGGGILNSGILTLTNSTVSGNSASLFGGGIYNNFGGTTILTNSTVSGNGAGSSGGGISNVGTVTLTNSAVSGNSASFNGGGIDNTNVGTVTLTNSTMSGNGAHNSGGGILNNGGTVTLTNSTVSGNDAIDHGGGIHVGSGTVNSFNSTIAGNAVFGSGGGVSVNSGGTFSFQNTILAGNSRQGVVVLPDECSGTINSNGFNLMRGLTCTVNGGGVTFADPQLGPLQDNGGPTQTHALLAGSPAIEAGNPTGCRDNLGALLATDQRGFLRPADGDGNGLARCDIGAYEAKAVMGDEVFVFAQYVDFLDREPGPGELAAWKNALSGGFPRASLIEAFMDSGEFLFTGKFIAQTYLGILTRDADVGGFEGWLGALLAGVSREQIVQAFLGSGEFQSRFGSNLTNAQFVERMYNNILLRPSDPGGFNGWFQVLNSGQVTRAQLALTFLDSGEFQSLSASQNRVDVSLLYFDMLRRNPDAGGFSGWVALLNAGLPLASVIDAFLNSSEYLARF